MTPIIDISDKVLTAFTGYIGETVHLDQLGLTLSKNELTIACNLLTLFDMITTEKIEQDGLYKYKITETGAIVVNNGGLKKYFEDMNYGNTSDRT